MSGNDMEAVVRALASGCPDGFTEFQAQQVMQWAEKAFADNLLLEMILKGRIRISNVRHSVEETCTFDISLQSVGGS